MVRTMQIRTKKKSLVPGTTDQAKSTYRAKAVPLWMMPCINGYTLGTLK